MRRIRLLAALLAALCLLGSHGALAARPSLTATPGPTRAIEDAGFAVPEPPRCFYVLDGADVLSEATKRSLFFTSQAAYEGYGVQLVVATVESTDGVDIGDYARALYDRWGIGTKKNASGLLLVLAVGDGDYCVVEGPNHELGYYLLNWLEGEEKYFNAGEYDTFVGNFAAKYTFEMLKRSDASPQRSEYDVYSDYSDAMQHVALDIGYEAALAEADWRAAGGDWSALTAEGGGGSAYGGAVGRRDVLEKAERAVRRRQSEERQARQDGRQWTPLMLLLVLVIVALIVFDLRHGGHFTSFLLRLLLEVLVHAVFHGDGDSGGGGGRGGGGHSSGGGGGSFSGGGAGRGR